MMLEPSFAFPLIYVLVPTLLSALLLYVVIRFGVKHGMRSYYAEVDRGKSDGGV